MSHEIRTLLNGIVGTADLMRTLPMADSQREYADIIYQAGILLLELLTEILDCSKIDERSEELEALSYCPAILVREVVEAVRATEREPRHTNVLTQAKLALIQAEFAASLVALRPEPVG